MTVLSTLQHLIASGKIAKDEPFTLVLKGYDTFDLVRLGQPSATGVGHSFWVQDGVVYLEHRDRTVIFREDEIIAIGLDRRRPLKKPEPEPEPEPEERKSAYDCLARLIDFGTKYTHKYKDLTDDQLTALLWLVGEFSARSAPSEFDIDKESYPGRRRAIAALKALSGFDRKPMTVDQVRQYIRRCLNKPRSS